MPKLTNHQVGQAGEHLVAGELHRRGAYAVTFSGNMPDIDILASSSDHGRKVAIQVKTKSSGTWHSSTARGEVRREDPGEDRFWVLVDIGKDPDSSPTYYIVPDWWMTTHIAEENAAYLARHGGQRARNPEATHFAIKPKLVEQWRECWDVLGVLPVADSPQ